MTDSPSDGGPARAGRAERALSFGAIAEDYDRLRPPPPDAAVDWLLPLGCRVAVDLGAGTGLLTRALARRAGRAARVIAVEPDERMRAVLAARSPGVEVLAGRGEAIPLPDASADGVFVSSAWHWLDQDLAIPEIGRVLRDGGRLGLIWTSPDRDDGWLADLAGLAQQPDLPRQGDLDATPTPEPGRESGSETGRADAGYRHRWVTIPDGAPLGAVASRSFRFSRPMSVSSIVELMATYSRVITASPAERAEYLARTAAALRRRFGADDEVDVPMRSWCWRAERTLRARRPG